MTETHTVRVQVEQQCDSGSVRVLSLLLHAQNPVTLPGSPFRVPSKDVVDPSKVKIAGPGLSSCVRACIPQSFTVDSSKAGLAPLEVRVLGPRGESASCLPPTFTHHGPEPVLSYEIVYELIVKYSQLIYCSPV